MCQNVRIHVVSNVRIHVVSRVSECTYIFFDMGSHTRVQHSILHTSRNDFEGGGLVVGIMAGHVVVGVGVVVVVAGVGVVVVVMK